MSLGLGLIGCGAVARAQHLPALRRVRDLRVVAAADVDVSACRDLADRWSIPRCHSTVEALLADPAVEAVAICVPATAHVEVAIAALDAGRHVFMEKPVALSLGEADRLIERARTSVVTVLHGFNLRWHRLIRTARALVREGALGTVHAIGTTYSYPLRETALPAWRIRRAQGGGALFEEAIHYVDLWRYLLDDEVSEVFARIAARGEHDETVIINARMCSGALAATFVTNASGVCNEVLLHGDRGALRIDCFRSDGLQIGSPLDHPGAPGTRVRRAVHRTRQLLANLGDIRRGGVFNRSYEAQWRHFAEVVRNGGQPACTLEDGRRALEVVLAAIEADGRGTRVLLRDRRE